MLGLGKGASARQEDDMTHITEQVTGDKLKAGDVIWNHGRWVVTEVRLNRPGNMPGQVRTIVVADRHPDEVTPDAAFAKDVQFGLRNDLHWTREVEA